jgi:hypothetical protein
MYRSLAALVPAFAVALAACGHPTSAPADLGPPPICKPGTPPPQPWFTEVTSEMGLGTPAQPLAQAENLVAADVDGDGWVDLFASYGYNAERSATPLHFLLFNRPDPTDPSKRVFVDQFAASGLSATRDGAGQRGFGGAQFADLDNDGDLDALVCPGAFNDPKVQDGCAAFLNDGKGHFTLAAASDFDVFGVFNMGSIGAILDFDRDGVLDFWPCTFGGPPFLFKGAGAGLFNEVSSQYGLPITQGSDAQDSSFRVSFGVTACDLDGDGDDDVLLSDYGRTENWIWRNDGDHFTEVGQALGLAHDDRVDYSDDQSYRCWCSLNPGKCDPALPKPVVTCPPVAGQRVWMPGVSDQPWQLGGNNMTFACADYDNDGDTDLMISTIVHWDVGQSSDPTELLRNDAPPGGPLMKFTRPGNAATGLERTHASADWNDGDLGVTFADVDLDGLEDLYVTSSDYPGDRGYLFHQKPDHTFEEVAVAVGAAQREPSGIALVDIDRDGDLDLVLGTSTFRSVAPNQALRVYRNNAADSMNWVQVKLVGLGAGAANVSAIGARVRVTAGGIVRTKELTGAFGHANIQNDLILTFGLGATCNIDELEVRWPDAAGTVQRFSGVLANYRVELHQGSQEVHYVVP